MLEEERGKKLKTERPHPFTYKIEVACDAEKYFELSTDLGDWLEYDFDAQVYCPQKKIENCWYYRFDKQFHHVPPTCLGEEFFDFNLFFQTDDLSEVLTVFLGTKGDHFRFEKVLLTGGSRLHVTGFSPYNWFCIAPVPSDLVKIVVIKSTHIANPSDAECFESISLDLNLYKAEFIDSSMLQVDNFLNDSKKDQLISLLENLNFQENINATLHWFEEPSEAVNDPQGMLSPLFWYSKKFISFLEDLTNLSLDIPFDPPNWKKFSPGHYIILNDRYPEQDGLDLIFTLSPKDKIEGGDWVYLDEGGEEIARFAPQSNSLVLVYRAPDSNVKRFKQYWNKFDSSEQCFSYQMIITFRTKSS